MRDEAWRQGVMVLPSDRNKVSPSGSAWGRGPTLLLPWVCPCLSASLNIAPVLTLKNRSGKMHQTQPSKRCACENGGRVGGTGVDLVELREGREGQSFDCGRSNSKNYHRPCLLAKGEGPGSTSRAILLPSRHLAMSRDLKKKKSWYF